MKKLIGLTGFLLLGGCSLFRPAIDDYVPPEFEYPGPDSETEEILDDYRDRYRMHTSRVVATAHDTLKFGKPDSGLNNLVADAIRFRAAEESQRFVHLGVIGISPFGVWFEPGKITFGDMFEFLPEDDHLVILTLTGHRVYELLQQVAAQGGAPVSGARFMLGPGNQAKGILVNAEVINLEKEYLVATSSRFADGEGPFIALWNPVRRQDYDVSMKELLIDHFRRESDLYNITDARIRS